MTEFAKTLFIIVLRLSYVSAALFAFVLLLNTALSVIYVGVNQNVLSDLVGLVQLWLPFNLNVIFLWIVTSSVAWVTYKLSLVALGFLNRLLSNT